MSKRRLPDYLLLFAKGMAMGAADVVPGVSGGTIAFISGIYAELLNTLKGFNLRSLALLKQGVVPFWEGLNLNFLLVLLLGIVTSIASFAHGIKHALDHHPILVWGFFFGLILASSIYMARQLPRWRSEEIISLSAGAGIAVLISLLPAVQLPESPLYFFCVGGIAICAMILPGISGSFLLLLMGMYSPVLKAVSDFDIVLLGCFIAGAAVGLLSFSRVLSTLLNRFKDPTLAFLTGFLLGSLNLVWPWKIATEITIKSSGDVVPLMQENLLPSVYQAETGEPSQWMATVGLAIMGGVLVLMLEFWGEYRNQAGNCA